MCICGLLFLFSCHAQKVNAKLVQQRCHEKLAKEFEYIRAHANEPLASFMDYIRYEYQIQTVISLLKATTKGYEPASEEIQEVMDTCHPLGKFDESVMRSITAFDSSPDGLEELYATVLVEIPVGKYFSQFLAEETEKSSVGGVEEARTRLREMPLATLENSIYKLYLEDFHRFCLSMEGETAEQMDRILSMRADMISINITYNSLRTHYNNSAERESSRKALYPSFGALYPEGTFELAKVDSESGIGAILQKYGDYARVWESAPTRQIEQDYYTGDDEEDVEGQQQQEGGLGGGLASAAAGSSEERDIAQAFFQHTVKVLETAFDGQFHFGKSHMYGPSSSK